MDRRFFHRLGASRLDRTICSSAGGAGLVEALGFRYGTEPEQFRNSKLIIAWGANVLATNVHLWPFIVEARRNGAKFYVIDPHRNRTGQLADRHYPISPGSDAALALGMMHVIIRETCMMPTTLRKHTAWIQRSTPTGSRLHSVLRCKMDRNSGRRHRPTGARVRHHPASGDPPELWRAAERARRHGGALHRLSAGADRVLEGSRRWPATLHLAGLPVDRKSLERPDLRTATPPAW